MLEQYMQKYKWAENNMKPLYLLVTKDKYQLPLAVADTAEELARIVGVNQSTIIKCINRRKKSQYIRIYVDLEEDE